MPNSSENEIKLLAGRIKEINQILENPFVRRHSKSKVPTSTKNTKMDTPQNAELQAAIDNIPKEEIKAQTNSQNKIVALNADIIEKEQTKTKKHKKQLKTDPDYKPEVQENEKTQIIKPTKKEKKDIKEKKTKQPNKKKEKKDITEKKPRKPYTRKPKEVPKIIEVNNLPILSPQQYQQGNLQQDLNLNQDILQQQYQPENQQPTIPNLNINLSPQQPTSPNLNFQFPPNTSQNFFQNPYNMRHEDIYNSQSTLYPTQQQYQYKQSASLQNNLDDFFQNLNAPPNSPTQNTNDSHHSFIARKTPRSETSDRIQLSHSSITNSYKSEYSQDSTPNKEETIELHITAAEHEAIEYMTETYKKHYEEIEIEETKPQILAILQVVQEFLKK